MKTWYLEKSVVYSLGAFAGLTGRMQNEYGEDPDIGGFMDMLTLLNGVPMDMLVADDSILPAESIRTFYIDPNWVECLLDGAMSMGRGGSGKDYEHDIIARGMVSQNAYRGSAVLRSKRLGLAASDEPPQDIRSGFLLRSDLVRGWPGLEINCLQDGHPLNILRLSRLGDSIVFCIVEGEIDEIVITEPAESLYFGFEEDAQGKPVRELVSLKAGEVGSDTGASVMPVYHNEAKGVLNIADLAGAMDSKLNSMGKNGSYFSALEFAAEMIYERTRFHIKLDLK